MKFSIRTLAPAKAAAGCLVLAVQGGENLARIAQQTDKAAGGALRWQNDQLARRQPGSPAVIGSHVAVADFDGYVHLLSQADGRHGRVALAALDFYAHVDLFMTPTAALADVVLPVASAFEREALKIGFEISAEAQSLVQLRQAVVPPPGEARTDNPPMPPPACVGASCQRSARSRSGIC